MPYIDQNRRPPLDNYIEELAYEITSAGELNYVITRIVQEYTRSPGMNYQKICEVVGVLVNAKDEFYRRAAAPYEDQKIFENGDVYDGSN